MFWHGLLLWLLLVLFHFFEKKNSKKWYFFTLGVLGGAFWIFFHILGASWVSFRRLKTPLGPSWLGPGPRDRALRGAQEGFYRHKKHTFAWASWRPLGRLLGLLEASWALLDALEASKRRPRELQEAQEAPEIARKTWKFMHIKAKNLVLCW